MKICIAQTKSDKENLEKNIENHKKWIYKAIEKKADLIVFPELSLTSYEPSMSKKLAINQNDVRLSVFQEISNLNEIAIAIGIPIKQQSNIFICMVTFLPNKQKTIYSKQILHADELPYFAEGEKQVILNINNTKIAPAICYESLKLGHLENANKMGANIYLASVAKPQNGIEKALDYFPKAAAKYSIPILMSNSVGYCDNFESAGQSSIWDKKGNLIDQLDSKNEGILTYEN